MLEPPYDPATREMEAAAGDDGEEVGRHVRKHN